MQNLNKLNNYAFGKINKMNGHQFIIRFLKFEPCILCYLSETQNSIDSLRITIFRNEVSR